MEQSARKNASRRLIFDDETPLKNRFVSAYEDISSPMSLFPGVKALNKSHETDIFEENILPNSHDAVTSSLIDSITTTSKINLNENCLENVFENLLKRGFIVQNNSLFSDYGNATAMNLNVDNESLVCGQFECLSLLEGGVYGVLAVTTAKMADSLRSVRALASIGSHPHIISYFSSWTDGCFHYVQTEFCQENLPSLNRYCFDSATDYQVILEHISCALHYLHDVKKYVHNMVVGRNIFRSVGDGDRAVFKLGGFYRVTELPDSDKTAPLIDVKSLCATISLLLKDHGHDGETDDEDLRLLLSYLSLITKKIGDLTEEPAAVDLPCEFVKLLPSDYVKACNIWHWCCSSRLQQLQQRPQNFLFFETNTNGDGIRIKRTD